MDLHELLDAEPTLRNDGVKDGLVNIIVSVLLRDADCVCCVVHLHQVQGGVLGWKNAHGELLRLVEIVGLDPVQDAAKGDLVTSLAGKLADALAGSILGFRKLVSSRAREGRELGLALRVPDELVYAVDPKVDIGFT